MWDIADNDARDHVPPCRLQFFYAIGEFAKRDLKAPGDFGALRIRRDASAGALIKPPAQLTFETYGSAMEGRFRDFQEPRRGAERIAFGHRDQCPDLRSRHSVHRNVRRGGAGWSCRAGFAERAAKLVEEAMNARQQNRPACAEVA